MAMALPPSQTLDLDRQFAVVALTQAVKAYPEAIRKFSDERREWRYDVDHMPRAFATLRWRALAAEEARLLAEQGTALPAGIPSRAVPRVPSSPRPPSEPPVERHEKDRHHEEPHGAR